MLRAACTLLLALAFAPLARAQDEVLPISQQVPLLLKVLTYERVLMKSTSTSIRLGVLYDPADADSRNRGDEFAEEFIPFAEKTLRGHHVEVVPVPLSVDGVPVPPSGPLDVLYVMELAPSKLPPVVQWLRSHQVLSATPIEDAVNRGLDLGLVLHNGRTGAVVNLTACEAEGRLWADDFLRLCRVVRVE